MRPNERLHRLAVAVDGAITGRDLVRYLHHKYLSGAKMRDGRNYVLHPKEAQMNCVHPSFVLPMLCSVQAFTERQWLSSKPTRSTNEGSTIARGELDKSLFHTHRILPQQPPNPYGILEPRLRRELT
jgi:hypothetical protein